MGTSALEVEVTDREKKTVVVRELFHDFPVTVGRDPIATIRLERYPFITKFHAKLMLRPDGAVLVRDSGSMNGTTAGSGGKAIPPLEWIDLREHDMEFGIGPLRFAVRVVDAPRREVAPERGGALLSRIATAVPATSPDEGLAHLASAAEVREVSEEIREAHDSYRAAWRRLYDRLATSVGRLSPEVARSVVQALERDFPEMAQEPEFRALVTRLGVVSARSRESAALELLRELAVFYGVRPPGETQALIDFARKIQDAVSVLALSFVRLRDGLRSFQSQFEVETGGKAPAPTALDSAATPQEAATVMLDWTDPSERTRAVVQGLLGDLATHELALVNGVTRGGSALVARFAPGIVIEEFESAKRAGGVGFWGGHYRKLWEFYTRRHQDLAREESSMWRVLFGREFAQAYEDIPLQVAATEEDAGAPKWSPLANAGDPKRRTASKIEKTPETHGFDKGPTGTVLVPATAASRASAKEK